MCVGVMNTEQAIPAVLKQVGLTVADIDVFEVNEAFASQAMYCVKLLGMRHHIRTLHTCDMHIFLSHIHVHTASYLCTHLMVCVR